jgi:tRNA G46 methylase TrmB
MQFSVSDAADRNKSPILQVISGEIGPCASVLEICSGTGQHALHFAANLPHLTWQPSDTGDYLPALRERLQQEGGANLREVIELDVRANTGRGGSVSGTHLAKG